MNITPKFRFVEGSFDTETNKMLCIGSAVEVNMARVLCEALVKKLTKK